MWETPSSFSSPSYSCRVSSALPNKTNSVIHRPALCRYVFPRGNQSRIRTKNSTVWSKQPVKSSARFCPFISTLLSFFRLFSSIHIHVTMRVFASSRGLVHSGNQKWTRWTFAFDVSSIEHANLLSSHQQRHSSFLIPYPRLKTIRINQFSSFTSSRRFIYIHVFPRPPILHSLL